MKINMIMPDELLKQVDNASKSLNISRTAFINMAVSLKLQQDQMMTLLPEMMSYMKQSHQEQVQIMKDADMSELKDEDGKEIE